MKAVHKIYVNVDKDRLVKAITDAKAFYEEGYMDALSALRQQETVSNRNGLNEPLTLDELRNSAGSWVWVVVNYEHCKCDGWALVPTPAYVAFLDQTIPTDFYGKKFVAYRQKPEEGNHEM